ncbi:2-hydroxy-6-oxo-2,4-heptadienoate hydrolase [Aquamicrobium terrae]
MKTQTDITEERVVHNGFETFLRRSGSPTLPAMLLIHGSGPGATGWSNWQYLMPELGGQFDCLALDLCGYGGSPAPDAMPKNTAEWLEVRVAQIVTLVRKLGLDRAHLVGNSLGGALALHVALRAPDYCSTASR